MANDQLQTPLSSPNQSTSKKERNSNFELLRIFAIISVIFLHYSNNFQGFESACSVGKFGQLVYNSIYALSLPAVDLFLILSGFFLVNTSKRTWGKPLSLIILAILIKLVIGLSTMAYCGSFVPKTIIRLLIPASYFINIYCVVYVLSPFINLIFSVNRKKLNVLIIILICVFSIWTTLANVTQSICDISLNGSFPTGMAGSDRGFTFVNFTLCYIIGGYLRKTNLNILKSQFIRLIAIIVLCLLLGALYTLNTNLRSTSSLGGYDSILIILLSVVIFEFFKNLNIGTLKIINYAANATFFVYLVHLKVLSLIFSYLERIPYIDNLNLVFLIFFIIVGTWIISVALEKITVLFFKYPIQIWKKSKLYNSSVYPQ